MGFVRRPSVIRALAAIVIACGLILAGTSGLGAGAQDPDRPDEDVGLGIFPGASVSFDAADSVARQWNEVLLETIRRDLARPTVHARNLFHASAAMYDIWSIFDAQATGYFIGHPLLDGRCDLPDTHRAAYLALPDHEAAIGEAISYFMSHFLADRFELSPARHPATTLRLDTMRELGFGHSDETLARTDTSTGEPAALGNYLAGCVAEFAEVDGSNQTNDYRSQDYEPVNDPMWPDRASTELMTDPDRWQPLNFEVFIDQSGNMQDTPSFVGAEWGQVVPFALRDTDRSVQVRDDTDYPVYLDPGSPVTLADDETRTEYQWGHSLVARWSSHLDHTDGVTIDISPGALGRSVEPPTDPRVFDTYYDRTDGGTTALGHAQNPVTGLPYEPNVVARGDYTRVLAEFWADGPDSETPPGHWYTILNELVSDHPATSKQFMGVGPVRSDLEWDILSYFTLGAAMHDSAIAAWSVKGWYDYVRPISAIRHMALLGQSSDPTLDNYHPDGLPLEAGSIEIIAEGDPLAGDDDQHVGELKVWSWAGADSSASTDRSNVRWIRATEWLPYQRPTFVTPPFAGYVSGHSTFSRAAAEVLTAITGDEFFPGGVGEFTATKDEFLVFETGPSTDITLQWATYRDASDQTSLSRIWGGIHPPIDDLPGRQIGVQVATRALDLVEQYLDGQQPDASEVIAAPRPTPIPQTPEELATGSTIPKSRTARWLDSRMNRAFVSAGIVALLVLLANAMYRHGTRRWERRNADG